jgi:hypothetical protein
MMRCYFNVTDGAVTLDGVGTEFPDLKSAQRSAVITAAEVLRDGHSDQLWYGEPWRLWVTDQPAGKGSVLFILNFSAAIGAASLKRSPDSQAANTPA